MKKGQVEDFSEKQREVLKSVRTSRIILPVIIGVGVVIYLLWKQFNPEEFAKIEWTRHAVFWIGVSFLLLIVRHIAYANRLRILSDGEFSWRKCVELIFIWEFSSAVSPTSVGGSAVALFVLSQEKLPAAKTAAIVIYTVVLDTIFFVGTLPILFFIVGPEMIRPDMVEFSTMDGWGYTFMVAYVMMGVYGTFFFYGLFISPIQFKRIIVGFTMLKFFRKYRHNAIELGNELILASREIGSRKWSYHIGAFLSTATAWSCRFLLLNCLIIAIVTGTSLDFLFQLGLFARLETMFVIMAFSPTPGGAGFAEVVFGGFLSDYVPLGIAIIIAFIWRLFTYYLYLFAGAIVIPNWIRKIINKRQRA